jgi:hypothetical protein
VSVAAALVVGAALAVPTWSSASGAPHATQRSAAAWSPQKGIAISMTNANLVTDDHAMQIGAQLFSMLSTKLHANAVSFNFPFWQAGSKANNPQRAAMTPSPGRLAQLTELAHRYGLQVQYRPFLNEKNLTQTSRPSITPTNVALWFQSYWAFLQPYLASAAQAGASSFSVALEFTTLLPCMASTGTGCPNPTWHCPTCLSQWEQLVQKAKAVFPGPIIYSQQHVPQQTIPLTERGYDAYQPVCPAQPGRTVDRTWACPKTAANQVSVAAFTTGFVHNFQMAGMQSTPQDLIAEEVGIPAVAGAYLKPNYYHYDTGTPVDRAVQTDWFAGACAAFRQLHVAGIYFWSIDFDSFTPSESANNPPNIYNWLGTSSATAIASCFAAIP